jgi:hypothetical protein
MIYKYYKSKSGKGQRGITFFARFSGAWVAGSIIFSFSDDETRKHPLGPLNRYELAECLVIESGLMPVTPDFKGEGTGEGKTLGE